MRDEEREDLSKRSNFLRLELKAWEKEFSSSNNGQKASRDDIKKNPEIAQKYKDYNRTRDILSGKIILDAAPNFSPRKRKHEPETSQDVSKRLRIMKTPSKTSSKPWEVDPYESPSTIRKLFTPSKRTAIGPTPQKDGQVLGLFDLLQEDGTPIKSGNVVIAKTSIQATPRKPAGTPSSTMKHSRTPASSGRRFMLDQFATPLKSLKFKGQDGVQQSILKLQFSTPSYLRRDSQRQLTIVNENDESLELSPQMVRVPRKPLVRGLSSILAGLRKIEEDAADDDLEALREMENEEMGGGNNPITKTNTVPQETVLVAGSQPGFPLGGFDDEALYDSEPEDIKNPTLGRDGQPLKVYKKKGQKRTTRRVKMKPSRSKPQQHPDTILEEDSEDELAGDLDPILETQIDDTADFAEARNYDSDSQSEYTASEGGTRYKRPDQSKKAKRITKDGKIKTVARKVTAAAHQNFKRLKLRNSGAKGGPAHNSRFRRKK